MKRSLLVAAGTAAGVTAVVSYHATASTSAAGLAAPTPPVSTHARTTAAMTTTATTSSTPTATTTTSSTTTAKPRTPSTALATRSAVGEAVSFQYGSLQLKVTERSGKITNVSVVSFQVNDPHSQSIDEFAVPRLRHEVIAAQSAKIDGVSGASYTSQAYAQSVQSALDQL